MPTQMRRRPASLSGIEAYLKPDQEMIHTFTAVFTLSCEKALRIPLRGTEASVGPLVCTLIDARTLEQRAAVGRPYEI